MDYNMTKWFYVGVKSMSGKKFFISSTFFSFQVLDTTTSPVFLLSYVVTLLE